MQPASAKGRQHRDAARAASAVGAAVMAALAVFETGLAVGLPWGAAAWGGSQPVLSPGLRLASAGAAAVWMAGLLVVLRRGGYRVWSPLPDRRRRVDPCRLCDRHGPGQCRFTQRRRTGGNDASIGGPGRDMCLRGTVGRSPFSSVDAVEPLRATPRIRAQSPSKRVKPTQLVKTRQSDPFEPVDSPISRWPDIAGCPSGPPEGVNRPGPTTFSSP